MSNILTNTMYKIGGQCFYIFTCHYLVSSAAKKTLNKEQPFIMQLIGQQQLELIQSD